MSLVPLNFRIDETLKKDAEKLAEEFDIPASQFYRLAIEDAVNFYQKNEKAQLAITKRKKRT